MPRWQIANLKYKCSITLISLLEAQKNEEMVLRMSKSLQIEDIKRNITDIFLMFSD